MMKDESFGHDYQLPEWNPEEIVQEAYRKFIEQLSDYSWWK